MHGHAADVVRRKLEGGRSELCRSWLGRMAVKRPLHRRWKVQQAASLSFLWSLPVYT